MLDAAPHAWLTWAAVGLAIAIAAYGLFREALPKMFKGTTRGAFGPVFRSLEALHSGLISDYVAWIAVGFAAVVAAFAIV